MSATDNLFAVTAVERFDALCWSTESRDYSARVLQAGRDVLGDGWELREGTGFAPSRIEQGNVRVVYDHGALVVVESDRFGFEETSTVFRGKRSLQFPRALQFAAAALASGAAL